MTTSSSTSRTTTMRETSALAALAPFLCAGLLGLTASAAAQSPDLREIRPDVILLVDTSASMDYAMGSTSGPSGQFPMCTGNAASTSGRSRWITLVESLTGTYGADYYCTTTDRRTAFVGAPDQFAAHTYAAPHGTQGNDGVLDQYIDRVRFGLMTFDNIYGLDNLTPASTQFMVQSDLTPGVDIWAANATATIGPHGDYSYGNAYPLTFPGCAHRYMVNGGARRPLTAAETAARVVIGGSMVSVGNASQDIHVTNGAIQTALLAARPFGSTPTGAMLDDLRYYLTNDPDAARIGAVGASGDPYQVCRRRYAILITDGESSDPFRSELHCDASGSTCPYGRPADIAADLCRYDGTQCTGLLNGLFVVAFAGGTGSACSAASDCAVGQSCVSGRCVATGPSCATDSNCATGLTCVTGHCMGAVPELNSIALGGGTTQAIPAIDRATLLGGLSRALDQAQPGTTTRTAPAFSLSQASYAATALGATSAPQEQLQMGSGFQVSDPTTNAPWTGVLDRTHFLCDATLTPVQQPLTATDHFAGVLNARNLTGSPRRLLTVAVPYANESWIITGAVGSGLTIPLSNPSSPTSVAPLRNQVLSAFETTNTSITPQSFGLPMTDTTTQAAIIDYVHGRAPANRAAARLGDIYHSTPQVITPPRFDIDDQAYALFRQRAEVSGRPSVVYVGSNDGVLHAFALEDDPTGAVRWSAGQELWGFVPPTLMPNTLNSGRTSHQFMVDGTPVVRDVVFRRASGDSAAPDTYHSVLVVGLRGGGNAYLALDVTDPLNPVFLWQWTAAQMGMTYGRPGLGQAMVNINGTLQERAIAILPGGSGIVDTASATANGSAGCPSLVSSQPSPRPDGVTSTRVGRRCWTSGNGSGRSLYVVDVATGELLRSFDATTISSPMTGGVSLFSGDLGQFATRAFVTDADGVVWRLDISSSDISSWTFTPMHDLYWADGALAGQPVYDPPIVSVDNQGNPVIVVGGGDQDNLEGAAPTRVVSLTEIVDHTQTPATSAFTLNWEIRMQLGEQVTGPMVLYSNYVYFGTFWSNPDPTNACSYGSSRIWGVHYLTNTGTPPLPYTSGVPGRFPTPGLIGVSGAVDTFFTSYTGIVFGVGVTQRPDCSTGATITDTYLGSRYQVSNLQPGTFQLVAQVSGTGASSSPANASSVQTVTVASLPPPLAQTRPLSHQSAADF